jgi:DNA-binding response OmpR family regulator
MKKLGNIEYPGPVIIYRNAYLRDIITVNIVPHHPTANNLENKNGDPKFILIGEDDIDDEELLKELFSAVDDSFSLHFIENGRQVVEQLNTLPDNHLPCLIILDYNMPELNGANILKELKNHQRYNEIPKIIWSTSKTETYKKKCLELGADDYVIKPSSVNELLDTIRYMISFC